VSPRARAPATSRRAPLRDRAPRRARRRSRPGRYATWGRPTGTANRTRRAPCAACGCPHGPGARVRARPIRRRRRWCCPGSVQGTPWSSRVRRRRPTSAGATRRQVPCARAVRRRPWRACCRGGPWWPHRATGRAVAPSGVRRPRRLEGARSSTRSPAHRRRWSGRRWRCCPGRRPVPRCHRERARFARPARCRCGTVRSVRCRACRATMRGAGRRGSRGAGWRRERGVPVPSPARCPLRGPGCRRRAGLPSGSAPSAGLRGGAAIPCRWRPGRVPRCRGTTRRGVCVWSPACHEPQRGPRRACRAGFEASVRSRGGVKRPRRGSWRRQTPFIHNRDHGWWQ
jgi:hypothetical protein